MKNRKNKFLFLALVIFIAAAFWLNHRGGVVAGVIEGDDKKLRVVVMDVGQGDAIFIRTPQQQDIVLDGGPDNSAEKKLGNYMPFDDRDIEYMILTHPHEDHVTGLVEMARHYTVKQFFTTGVVYNSAAYRELLGLLQEKNVPIKIITAPQDIAIENNLTLKILYPYSSLDGVAMKNVNNASIVSLLSFASTTALFSGDYEQEETLIDAYKNISVDVYKVGHHGSNNANSEKFLQFIHPHYAIISVGAENMYGHPHYRTIKTLGEIGANILRTDRDGDIIMESDGHDFLIKK